MKIKPYINKLNDSSEFKSFQKTHNDSFLVAGFFVLDLESGKNIHQIDYYVPSKKKIAAFNLDQKVTMQMLDLLNSKVPEKLDLKTNLDLDQLYGVLEDEMKNRSITADIKKIIAILQNIEGKKIWNLSCVLSGMGLLNAHVEDSTKSVLKMEKRSLMDMIRKINPADLKMPQGADGEGTSGEGEGPSGIRAGAADKKKEIENQIKKLDMLEKAIEKEKAALAEQGKKSVKSLGKGKKR